MIDENIYDSYAAVARYWRDRAAATKAMIKSRKGPKDDRATLKIMVTRYERLAKEAENEEEKVHGLHTGQD